MPDKLFPPPWGYDELGGFIIADDGTMVAQVRGWGHLVGTGGLNLSEAEADAIQAVNGRKLAAAPDLLSACKRARTALSECAEDTVGTPARMFFESEVQELDAAIAKAEGRS